LAFASAQRNRHPRGGSGKETINYSQQTENVTPSGSRRFQAMKTIKRLTMAAIARQRDANRCLRQAQGKSNNGVTLQRLRRGPTRLNIRKKTKGVSHE
jgi:hypothetical protein